MACGNPRERTSLIVTVLQEAETIDRLLASIDAQSRPPDEVVVVDGGSTDGTWQKLQAWAAGAGLGQAHGERTASAAAEPPDSAKITPARTAGAPPIDSPKGTPDTAVGGGRAALRLIQAPGVGIARGRNVAIEAASGDIIVVTDAGVRLEPDWLEQLGAQLSEEVDVVSGFFRSEACSTFERAMGATVLPDLRDINPGTFLPSSRSILFRRTAWATVGGYPEWLDYCEDVVFDLALKRAGLRFAFAPEAIAWFRPRGSLSAFFTQYYRYARGDGKADLWRRRHAIRYAAYAVAAMLLSKRPGLAMLVLAAAGLAYTRRPYARLLRSRGEWSPREAAYALALVPTIRLVGDVAKMLGYAVGIWWRLRDA